MRTSSRLTYYKLSPDHFEDYKSWYMDSDVMALITGRPLTFEEVDVRFEKALQTNRSYPDMGWYATYLNDTFEFVGIAKLTPLQPFVAEVGYGMLKPFWGQGYAQEMLTTLIRQARTIGGLQKLVGIIHPDNIASQKILTHAGFQFAREEHSDDGLSHYYELPL